MEKLQLELGKRSYDILFCRDEWKSFAKHLGQRIPTKNCCIVSQNSIFKYYGPEFYGLLRKSGYQVSVCIVPDGEQAKSVSTLNHLYDFLLKKGVDRNSLLIALGGGVVGDLTGYAAATFMRGLPFVQVPTTLLSAVDSSVGGKTGINFSGVKNVIGSFYQPKLVFIDTHFLTTLPKDEFISGLGEVLKYAILDGEDFFSFLEKVASDLHPHSPMLPDVIYKCCAAKAAIIEKDEFEEKGARMLLNFGHTMGHAVEALTKCRHGEAVSIGMIYAASLSVKMGLLPNRQFLRILALTKKLGLPWKMPDRISKEALREVIAKDKKKRGHKIHWILLRDLGKAAIVPIEASRLPG